MFNIPATGMSTYMFNIIEPSGHGWPDFYIPPLKELTKMSWFEEISIDPLCYFCGKSITKIRGKDPDSLAIHSVDGNHNNFTPSNKVPSHFSCHSRYHARNASKETLLKRSISVKKTMAEDRALWPEIRARLK